VVHGKILPDNTVICDQGWAGAACDEKPCPGDCSHHGLCNDGVCVCQPGFTGKLCSMVACKNDCHGRGVCLNGKCQCEKGWKGEDCSQRHVVHGIIMKNNTVICEENYTGAECDELLCKDNCNSNGVCRNGVCMCESNKWMGDTCNVKICPNNCSNNGECHEGAPQYMVF
jgi:syndecan 4